MGISPLIVIKINDTIDVMDEISAFIYTIFEEIKKLTSMRLEMLERIVLSDNPDRELEYLSRFTSGNQITRTKNNHAEAVAKIIHILKDDGKYDAILVLTDQYLDVYRNYPEAAIHLFHHELCHIHEFSLTDEVLYHFNRKNIELIDQNFLPLATMAWSEYFANRMSSSTVGEENIKWCVEVFSGYLSNVQQDILEWKYLYRIHQISLDEFLHVHFLPYTKGIFLSAAYLIGYCHGIGVELKELSPDMFTLLSSHIFCDIYFQMEQILKQMFESHPHDWDDNAYGLLYDVVVDLYFRFGISFKLVDGDKVWVNVF
ncbi:MAG: hypothetical protein PHW64_00345 [Sulfuricurvum sp.]|nr:hypothetical protein [Sulfuricurvum sp.]